MQNSFVTYVEFVWLEKLKKNRKVKIEHIVGRMKLKYRAIQVSSTPSLGLISQMSYLVRAALCRRFTDHWSEWRCADGLVTTING